MLASSGLPRLDLGLADLAADYDVLLCDVWGVVHNGVRHHAGAVDALRRFRAGGGTVVLVTNAPAPKARVAQRLNSLAVPHDAYDDIATSGDVTVRMIVDGGCPPLLHIGPRDETVLYDSAAALGPRRPPLVAAEAADLAICVGLDDERAEPEAYDDLLRALKARDCAMICANPDLVVEVGDQLVFCAGAIAERYEAIGGAVVQAGKPFAAIYEAALAMAAATRGATIPRDRVLAIGDAMRTDMQGAATQGVAGLFVTAGIHRDVLHDNGRTERIDAAVLSRFLDDYPARPLAAVPRLVWRA